MDAQVKPWLLCRSGAAYTYGDVTCPGLNFVLDVVTPVCRINRYLGHTDEAWCVGAHEVLCSVIADLEGEPTSIVEECLHHDDGEALVGDCPTPVKRLLGAAFDDLETAAVLAIADAARRAGYRYTVPTKAHYQRYDRIALMAERIALKVPTPPGRKWGYDYNDADTLLIRKSVKEVHRAVEAGANYGEGAVRAYLRVLREYAQRGVSNVRA